MVFVVVTAVEKTERQGSDRGAATGLRLVSNRLDSALIHDMLSAGGAGHLILMLADHHLSVYSCLVSCC